MKIQRIPLLIFAVCLFYSCSSDSQTYHGTWTGSYLETFDLEYHFEGDEFEQQTLYNGKVTGASKGKIIVSGDLLTLNYEYFLKIDNETNQKDWQMDNRVIKIRFEQSEDNMRFEFIESGRILNLEKKG